MVQVSQPINIAVFDKKIDIAVNTHIEEREGGRNDDVDDLLCKLL